MASFGQLRGAWRSAFIRYERSGQVSHPYQSSPAPSSEVRDCSPVAVTTTCDGGILQVTSEIERKRKKAKEREREPGVLAGYMNPPLPVTIPKVSRKWLP